VIVGLIGKPNVGKTTFFVAATMKDAEIADYPFTTIEPNVGVAYLKTDCVCHEFNVNDNPRNSLCIKGKRMIPVKLVDIAGLVEGASEGRGKGNKFLDEVRQADALIHVVDASGSTDSEGRHVHPGTWDPIKDIEIVEREFDLWLFSIIMKDWDKISRISEMDGKLAENLSQRLSGLSITKGQVESVIEKFGNDKKYSAWDKEKIFVIASELRKISKPSIIAANKCDIATAEKNIERMKQKGRRVIPCSAEAELLLRKAANSGLIDYEPGAGSFSIRETAKLSKTQIEALRMVEEKVLKKYGSTGVQEVINSSYFDLLGCIVVYPVEDERKLSDSKGNVLPDAYVMKEGSTALDLAYAIHTELGEKFLYAIDARKGIRLGGNYRLKNRDVIKIVST
jgi:ribosome-binding ATPase YchF (GTP1/OBG family)